MDACVHHCAAKSLSRIACLNQGHLVWERGAPTAFKAHGMHHRCAGFCSVTLCTTPTTFSWGIIGAYHRSGQRRRGAHTLMVTQPMSQIPYHPLQGMSVCKCMQSCFGIPGHAMCPRVRSRCPSVHFCQCVPFAVHQRLCNDVFGGHLLERAWAFIHGCWMVSWQTASMLILRLRQGVHCTVVSCRACTFSCEHSLSSLPKKCSTSLKDA